MLGENNVGMSKFDKPAPNTLFVGCNARIAQIVGANAAIVHNKIAYCIKENQTKGIHLIEGRTWTHLTHKQIADKLQMMTVREVGYAIEKLEQHHLIITGNYNKWGADKTTWYAIDDSILKTFYPAEIMPREPETEMQVPSTNLQVPQTNLQPHNLQNCKSDNGNIPYNTTDKKSPNYSSKENDSFSNYENANVNSTAKPVANDSADANDGVFDKETWRKWKGILPDGRFDAEQATKVKLLLDDYGDDLLKEYIEYVKGFDKNYSLANFIEEVDKQLSMSRDDARRNGKKFGRFDYSHFRRW